MSQTDLHLLRQSLADARRLVIKVGSHVLVQPSGRPDVEHIRRLVGEIARLRRQGRDVVLVSSGAIAAGVEALELGARPTDLPRLQMAAAVGQVRLMTAYDDYFSEEGYRIAQVLLTYDDLRHRARHLNARNTMMQLLSQGIVPVVNENDVVAVDEIKFGDNDILAAQVAILIEAEALLLLTTTDGLHADGDRVPHLPAVTRETLDLVSGKRGAFALGGMASKLRSAQIAAEVGVLVVIADGRQPAVIGRAVGGEDVGTLLGSREPPRRSNMRGRKRWIAFFHKTRGALIVDDGAEAALENGGNSLLAIGIRAIEGHFGKGSLVNIKSQAGRLIARGLAGYSSDDIRKIMGHQSSDITELLGYKDYDEVVHRENMVVLAKADGEVL